MGLAYYNTSTDYSHGWQVRITYTPMSVMQESNDVIVTPDVADWAQAIEGPLRVGHEDGNVSLDAPDWQRVVTTVAGGGCRA